MIACASAYGRAMFLAAETPLRNRKTTQDAHYYRKSTENSKSKTTTMTTATGKGRRN